MGPYQWIADLIKNWSLVVVAAGAGSGEGGGDGGAEGVGKEVVTEVGKEVTCYTVRASLCT